MAPSSIGANGYRYYDERSLLRLQRILLLRELGLRLHRQIASVTSTIDALRRGTPIMAEQMFDGFDHTQYKDEVEQRWGADTCSKSDAWWRGMSEEQRAAWKQRTAQLSAEWVSAAQNGVKPGSAEAQALAARHVEWLTDVPGTPANSRGADARAYVIGLGELYVADPRFGAAYADSEGGNAPMFVRDALRIYAEATL